MMETDGRDRVMCQIVTKRDNMRILEILNDNKTKIQIVSSPIFKLRPKRGGEREIDAVCLKMVILVRE